MSDKIRLEITFKSGETITYQPEQWVGIYNFDSVFCVELKPC